MTLSKSDTQQNNSLLCAECRYAEFCYAEYSGAIFDNSQY
jgi:hypothetical protein